LSGAAFGRDGQGDYAINGNGSELLADAEADAEIAGKTAAKKGRFDGFMVALLFGALNAIIIVPVMVAYTNIIFRDQFFRPYLPGLVKLVFFSSIMHQVAFTSLSTLKFVRALPQVSPIWVPRPKLHRCANRPHAS
jgi:SulP family sulfate permease